jgi:outer membrane biosynthesis protein TonB
VEEEFSYLRVFGAAVPPLALPQFIPDKLACREIARQTVIGGVSKELKASAKKVWSSFPIRLNSYSLLDFGHAKAEAAALEGLNLAYIEYKRHDPQRIVSTHLGNCGLKRFEHESSPSDDVFRGATSYSEVQFRIESLAAEDRDSVLKFQANRKRCLPVVLGGLALPKDKEKEAESSEGQTSNPKKHQEGEREKSPEREENPKTEKEAADPPKEQNSEVEIKDTNPPETQNPETGTKTSDPPKEQDPLSTPGKAAKQIGQPITSVTPLQSAQGNVQEGWIFGEELRPIRAEELPPNEFFFDKKRKAVVKQEFHQEGESTVKKYRVITDGKNKKKDEFATEIAGTLGAYATTNQFSVAALKNQLKAKNQLIKTLEARIASAAEDAKSQASGAIELAQLADRKEIEVLKTKLEKANSVIRDGRVQFGHQRDMITQLQAQLEVTESKVIDVEIVKSRAIDIRSRISSAQQSLLNKIGEFRKNCLLMNRISKNLIVKERNAEAAWVVFQEAVIATNNRFSTGTPGLSVAEQTRGNILLKNWEHDIALSKEQAQKVTNSLEEIFKNINAELLGMENGGDTETLRQINMERISLDIKEKNERDLVEISKMDRAGMAQIDEHLIQPSTQLGTLDIVDTYMGNQLPQLARDCYFAEASCQAEPSQLISQFLDKCRICTESMQRQAPGTL